MKKLTILFLFIYSLAYSQGKVPYSIVNGAVKIQGVDGTNPVIADNDYVNDSPDVWYLWVKANRKEVNLVGNISTRDAHPQGRSHNETYGTWMSAYNIANSTGMKNIPSPVRGSSRPYNGTTEQSVGSDLIISEAKKASPSKPLVIFVGGQVTSIANAYLKDNSIAANIIIFHVAGINSGSYNQIDNQSAQICAKNMKYIGWSGNEYGWYDGAGYRGEANPPVNRLPGLTFNTPNNPFANAYKNNTSPAYHYYGSVGDLPPLTWFFNNSLWQNVVRKTISNQTVTGDNYDYLLVSQNKWEDYGSQLSATMNNPTNYIPVTGPTTPVNKPPSVVLNVGTSYPAGAVTLYADASDDDGSVSKVEFLVSGNKIGEDLTSPYGFVWNATAGTYNVSARAIDNLGFSSTSTKSVTITSVTVPPVETSGWLFDITQAPFFAKGDGSTNDAPAIQAAIDAAIRAHGKLVIPPAKNFYKTTQTLFIRPIDEAQAYITIEGQGKYWQQIVYQGVSGQPAVVIEGLKQGSSIQGMHVKIGDGVSNSAAFDIGTNNVSGSTSAFSFRNCTAEPNRGVNNAGFRVGKREGSGADVSQIDWYNCTVFGPFALIPGQIGWHFTGGNSFLFNIFGGSTVFCETGISVTAGGAIATFGYGSSQNGTELYMAHSTQVSFSGGRFESSKKFLKVEGSANFPGVSLRDMVISDFKPADGKLFEFLAPGGLTLDNVKIENSLNYGAGMITLGNNGGTLFVRGGAFNASDPFITQGAWRAKVENVVKLNEHYQSVGFFTNK